MTICNNPPLASHEVRISDRAQCDYSGHGRSVRVAAPFTSYLIQEFSRLLQVETRDR